MPKPILSWLSKSGVKFTQGSHSLLVHQSIQTAARNAAVNKNINQKITRWATPNRFVFSGYIKRYDLGIK
jgi:hypothetical protein